MSEHAEGRAGAYPVAEVAIRVACNVGERVEEPAGQARRGNGQGAERPADLHAQAHEALRSEARRECAIADRVAPKPGPQELLELGVLAEVVQEYRADPASEGLWPRNVAEGVMRSAHASYRLVVFLGPDLRFGRREQPPEGRGGLDGKPPRRRGRSALAPGCGSRSGEQRRELLPPTRDDRPRQGAVERGRVRLGRARAVLAAGILTY